MTRAEYLRSYSAAGDDAERWLVHRAYYAQFVTPDMVSSVASQVGHRRLMRSTDPHLNDIPRDVWDELCTFMPAGTFAKFGDSPNRAGMVCVRKEAARQYIDSQIDEVMSP